MINSKLGATNELITPKLLNQLVAFLKTTIPDFPNLQGKTIKYDYESEYKIISLTWRGGYDISEDHGNYVCDFDIDRNMIGIEILHFDLEEYITTGVIQWAIYTLKN